MTLLLESTIKTSVVLAIALASLRLLRHRSAALRHGVLAVAVCVAALMPLLSLALPSWRVDRVERAASGVTHVETTTIAGDTSRATETTAGSDGPRHVPEIVWLAGVLLGTIALVTGLARLARVASNSEAITEGHWPALTETISKEYGLRRAVRLLQSRNASILATWGVLRPVLILPAGAHAWPAERAVIVLRHELAHPASRLDGADGGAPAPRRVLVQSAALGDLSAAAAGKRIRLRRRRAVGGHSRTRLRHASFAARTRPQ